MRQQTDKQANLLKGERGFTTIELLVVIAVIAVLAAGVIAAANRMRNQAQNNQMRQVLSEVPATQESIAAERGGTYESGAGGSNQVTSGNDSRLVDLQEEMTDIENSAELIIVTANGDQDFAAAVTRPNGSGSFCIDNDGDSYG